MRQWVFPILACVPALRQAGNHTDASRNANPAPTAEQENFMVHIVEKDGEHVFMCDACGFHFRERSDADICERHCNTNKSCSEEITKRSIERKTLNPKP